MVHVSIRPGTSVPFQAVLGRDRTGSEPCIPIAVEVGLADGNERRRLGLERVAVEGEIEVYFALGTVDGRDTGLDALSVLLGWVCQVLDSDVTESSAGPGFDLEYERIGVDVRRAALDGHEVVAGPLE